MTKKTVTSAFGVGRREGHDASSFYSRKIYSNNGRHKPLSPNNTGESLMPQKNFYDNWYNKIYCQTSEYMPIPDSSIGLAFTSPPYNVGKDYDQDMDLEEYLSLIEQVGKEIYRVLVTGGRYVINIANLGRKPYIPLHRYFYEIHERIGFLPMGEIIWQKAQGANGSCAWGSWASAKAPRIRDVHEYLLVFAKEEYSRPDAGISDITPEEFTKATLSIWQIPPESARRVGHPAPFPVALAERVIRLYSYIGDVVLDPFMGSGSTCVAAMLNQRHYVGFDISPEYCRLAEERIRKAYFAIFQGDNHNAD